MKTFDDLKKCKDAIMWGTKIAGQLLPISCYAKIVKLLNAYKHKVAKPGGEGLMDYDQPTPSSPWHFSHKFLLKWVIEKYICLGLDFLPMEFCWSFTA
jgi:hypothetical protein